MSRDQILALGVFGSVTRANTRLRELSKLKLVHRLETPFFGQSLYRAGALASEIVAPQLAKLLDHRAPSPRFIAHALTVTNVRIALIAEDKHWRFEQQLWRTLEGRKSVVLRPDGLVLSSKLPIFIEVDMGHQSAAKFQLKLQSYEQLARSGRCKELYGFDTFRLLTVTTGLARARRLRTLLPDPAFDFLCETFEAVGACPIQPWS